MVFAEINKENFEKLPFGLNTLQSTSYQPPIDRPSGFAYHQFLWVTKGHGVYRTDTETRILQSGDGVFMRAHAPHSYEGEDWCTSWCTFSMSDAALDMLQVPTYLFFRVPRTLETETQQLLRFVNSESNLFARSAAGYSYVIDLFSGILTRRASLGDRVLQILETRYSEPISLDDLSEQLGVDRFALCHLYKQERGVTIMDDLSRIRIGKAKQLLKYNVASLEEIGRLCGFSSPSYFAKRFREATGHTPTSYRQKHRESR